MDFLWRFVLPAGVAAAAALWAARLPMHMLQLHGYKPGEYWNWLGENRRRLAGYGLISLVGLALWLMGVLLFPAWAGVAGGLGAALPLAVYGYRLGRRQEKKPLVFTPRMRTLYAALGLMLLVLAVLAGILLAGCQVLLPLILPLLPPLAVVVTRPIEKRVQRRFYQAAQAKLMDKTDRIRIGITGSYGKTSTKFFLGTILGEGYRTFVTPHSYNTTMGVVRAINEDMPGDTEIFVAEMGARYPGDIEELCRLVQPQYGLITSIGPQHLETFGSMETLISTKYELIEGLTAPALAAFPLDNPHARGMYERREGAPRLSFGLEEGDIRARDIGVGPEGSRFTLITPMGEAPCRTVLLGTHNIQNILGACAIAHSLGLTPEQMAAGIAKLEAVPHRLQLIKGQGGVTVIDDAFNANPAGTRAALAVLSAFPGRRIVVTPGLVELGDRQETENEAFGGAMAAVAQAVILLGPNRQAMARGLEKAGFAGELFEVKDLNHATAVLGKLTRPGDVVLFENDLPDNYGE